MRACFCFLLLCFVLGITACEDDQIPTEVGTIILDNQPNSCNAYIIETVSGNRYKPSNLRQEFEVDQLQVLFSFEITQDFHDCSFNGQIPIINISTIRNR